jgi:biopolymer transport protein ExbB
MALTLKVVLTGHLPGNMLAMVYKGGPIVPVLLGLLWLLCFHFERYAVISKAAGSGNLDQFMTSVQRDIKAGNIEGAIASCDKQKVLLLILLNQLIEIKKLKERFR